MFVTNNKNYKVRARGLKNWRDFDCVRLEISVGQSYHEGEKLGAMLNWAQENFSRIHLILGDTTQRYNLMMKGMDHDTALAHSDRLGRDWLHRNRKILMQTKNIHIHRWDEWRCSQEFPVILNQVKNLYEQNFEFSRALLHEVNDSFTRRLRRQECKDKDRELHTRLSLQYLLEETAVFAMFYRDFPGISAYPGSFGEMWQMFVNANVPGAPIGLNNAHNLCLSFEPRSVEMKRAA